MRYDSNALIGINFSTKAMFLFLMTTFILLPFVAEKKDKDAANIDPPSQGTLRVEMFWDDKQNIDVDLWVDGPVGDPVGYSNLGGPLWNLLRDDLGTNSDVSGRNMEIAFTRGIWDGEYQVNSHLYNLKEGTLPVRVRVVVSYKENMNAPSKELFYSNIELNRSGQEYTVFRFMVRDFKVVMDSLNRVPKDIRPAKKVTSPGAGGQR